MGNFRQVRFENRRIHRRSGSRIDHFDPICNRKTRLTDRIKSWTRRDKGRPVGNMRPFGSVGRAPGRPAFVTRAATDRNLYGPLLKTASLDLTSHNTARSRGDPCIAS